MFCKYHSPSLITDDSFLSPGYPSHPSVRGYINSMMPVTEDSLLYNEILDEPRVSYNSTIVSTRYDPNYYTNIEVRISSDTDHTGTNYYTGGQVLPTNTARGRRYFKLGTPLPEHLLMYGMQMVPFLIRLSTLLDPIHGLQVQHYLAQNQMFILSPCQPCGNRCMILA